MRVAFDEHELLRHDLPRQRWVAIRLVDSAYRDPDGWEQAAKITAEPFGPVPVAIPVRPVARWVSFTFSPDEAEALASRLAEVVAATRQGTSVAPTKA